MISAFSTFSVEKYVIKFCSKLPDMYGTADESSYVTETIKHIEKVCRKNSLDNFI